MKILRTLPIAIAVISAMVTVASSRTLASDMTILEATPQKLVLSIPDVSDQEKFRQHFEEAKKMAADHCKKFDRVAGVGSLKVTVGSSSDSKVITFKCEG